MTEKIAYFPGCSLHSSAKEYDLSCRLVLSRCGFALQEIEDWNCCGASPAHGVSEELALALPLRNMIIAEDRQYEGIFTPCAACYSRLRFADHETRKNPKMRERMAELVGKAYNNSLGIYHILDVLNGNIGLERIRSLITRPLVGLKMACYYGCLLVRPPGIAGVDPRVEDPEVMDELCVAMGAEPVIWPHKTECCGASQTLPHTDSVLRLCLRLLKSAKAAGADCLVAACPLCHANLDMRQAEVEKKYREPLQLPIVYITQLLGLAMGMTPEMMGMDRHLVSTSTFTAKLVTTQVDSL